MKSNVFFFFSSKSNNKCSQMIQSQILFSTLYLLLAFQLRFFFTPLVLGCNIKIQFFSTCVLHGDGLAPELMCVPPA